MSESAEDFAPIGDVLAGLSIESLPDDWKAVGAIVLVKCDDGGGDPVWAFRQTANVNDEEMLGALTVRTDIARKELLDAYGD